MMFNRPSHPYDVNGLEDARHQRLKRAGLRVAPRDGEPTTTFIAIELAVLVIVSALAMVTVIVTTCSPAEARAVASDAGSVAAKRHHADATQKRVAAPARLNDADPADRPIASPAAIE